MSMPDRIITNGNGITYYTIRKAQQILAAKLAEHADRLEGELKLLSPGDTEHINRIMIRSQAVGEFARLLNDEFTKFIIL